MVKLVVPCARDSYIVNHISSDNLVESNSNWNVNALVCYRKGFVCQIVYLSAPFVVNLVAETSDIASISSEQKPLI